MLTLIFYGVDHHPAQDKAAELRGEGHRAQVRHALAVRDEREPEATEIIILDDVEDHDAGRIRKLYDGVKEEKAKPNRRAGASLTSREPSAMATPTVTAETDAPAHPFDYPIPPTGDEPDPYEGVTMGALRKMLKEQIGTVPPRMSRATMIERLKAAGGGN